MMSGKGYPLANRLCYARERMSGLRSEYRLDAKGLLFKISAEIHNPELAHSGTMFLPKDKDISLDA